MGMLTSLFGKNEPKISTNKEFWDWFVTQEKTFHQVVKNHDRIEKDFLNKLGPKLKELRDGYNFLTGMMDDTTAELILTPDGVLENIVFTEELIADAPKIAGWKFTALKPAVASEDFGITMGPFKFSDETLSFYENESKEFPDEIAITICFDSYKEEDKPHIANGIYIYLDNFLGELKSISVIDNVDILTKAEAEKELVPISKLKEYLNWREKEFIEKYEGIRRATDKDTYHSMQAELPDGKPLLAIINTGLLAWDSTASHPWMMPVTISYKGENNSGMPGEKTYELLEKIEQEILKELKDVDGYLNIGRQTAAGERTIYFACKDFRKPAKTMDVIMKSYQDKVKINSELFKDKYWKSVQHFNPNFHTI